MPPPRSPRNSIQIGDGKPFPITKDGLVRLQEKLDRLKQALPGLAAEAQRTAAYGDRSENFEYQQAKGALRRSRIQVMIIENQIKQAVIIPEGRNASGTVQLGSTVVVEAIGKGMRTFHIVGPHETNPEGGRISHQSPLGSALMDAKEGDMVKIVIAGTPQSYRVIEVR